MIAYLKGIYLKIFERERFKYAPVNIHSIVNLNLKLTEDSNNNCVYRCKSAYFLL